MKNRLPCSPIYTALDFMAVNIQKTMKSVKQTHRCYMRQGLWLPLVCMLAHDRLTWQATGKLPKIRPSEFHCKLKILVILIFEPADTPYQLLRFFLCLLLEFGPMCHDDVGFKRCSYLDVRRSTCSYLVSYWAGDCFGSSTCIRKMMDSQYNVLWRNNGHS